MTSSSSLAMLDLPEPDAPFRKMTWPGEGSVARTTRILPKARLSACQRPISPLRVGSSPHLVLAPRFFFCANTSYGTQTQLAGFDRPYCWRYRGSWRPVSKFLVSLPVMKRPSILPVSAAVAAVALSASPAVVAASPAGRRDLNGPVAFPLLALRADTSPAAQGGHVSHSSHSSHISGGGSHSSHISHASHFSSTAPPPPAPSPSPSPTPTPTPVTDSPQPVTTNQAARKRKKRHHRRHHHATVAAPPSAPASPTAASSATGPSAAFTSRPASSTSPADSGGQVATDVSLAVVVAGGVTFWIYRRKKRSG